MISIGPALAGGTVAFALYGVSVCQMVLWFTKASRWGEYVSRLSFWHLTVAGFILGTGVMRLVG